MSFFFYLNMVKKYCLYKLGLSTSFHGEDEYHKKLHSNARIVYYFNVRNENEDWCVYKENVKGLIQNYIQSNFNEKLNGCSFVLETNKHNENVNITGDIITAELNNNDKSIKMCMNHYYCGGSFFLKGLGVLFNGVSPDLPSVPKFPFVNDYYLLKFCINRPDIPLNKCFSIIDSESKIKRLTFTLNKKEK